MSIFLKFDSKILFLSEINCFGMEGESIVLVKSDEFRAVLTVFEKAYGIDFDFKGESFVQNGNLILVTLKGDYEIDMLLSDFKPKHIVMIGVCSGRPGEVEPGDVIIASKVFLGEGQALEVYNIPQMSLGVVSRQCGKGKWRTYARNALDKSISIPEHPIAKVGPVAVVTQEQPNWNDLSGRDYTLIGSDQNNQMGLKFYKACSSYVQKGNKLEFAMIKGVKGGDEKGATLLAAGFACEFLKSF